MLIVERWILMALRHVQCRSLGEAQERVANLVERLNQRPLQKLPGTRQTRLQWEARESSLNSDYAMFALLGWR